MPPIIFNPSTEPSVNVTENGGRVINAYAERAPGGSRSEWIWRRAPGLRSLFTVGEGLYRGSVQIGAALFIVNGNTVYEVTRSGAEFAVNALPGSVPGDDLVIIARNSRTPNAQALIVSSSGVSLLEDGEVTAFADTNLPSINSVTFMDGYFFATSGDGRVFASGINSAAFSALDFATAEASTDGLVRAIAFGSDLLLMGEATIEFWQNTANPEAFPFSRGPVISVGLLGRYAVTGMEYGFPSPLAWVGNDKRIYRLAGYAPEPISTPAIDRVLSTVIDPLSVQAWCYSVAGHPCYVFSGPGFTFVYDSASGLWHERQSYGANQWVALGAANAFDGWVAFSREDGAAFAIQDRFTREGQQPLVFDVWSTQAHRFPGRFRVDRASFDLVTGVGRDSGIDPIQTRPQVSISWSDDGGRTWANDILRSLGTEGEIVGIDIRRCGLTGRFGRQWRVRVSDPVEVSLLGGAMDIVELAA